jgi:dipeptidyl aminopeptidase/acylaminoacyl peptidase
MVAACSPSPTGTPRIQTTPPETPEPVATASPAPSLLVGSPDVWVVYQGGDQPGGVTPLRLVHTDGTDDHLLMSTGAPGYDQGHPAWSPDGTTIAFDALFHREAPDDTGPDRVEIWVVGVDGAGPRQLAGCELPCLQVAYPAWSPDGKSIAIARYDIRDTGDWGQSAIEVIDVASGERRVVAETADGLSAYYTPRWSADGRSIAFTIETYPDEAELHIESSQIAVVAAAGGAPTILSAQHRAATQPEWSPSERIVYLAAPTADAFATGGHLESMLADGSDVRTDVAPDAAASPGEPTWLPDGSLLFVVDDPGGAERLAVLPAGAPAPLIAGWIFQSPPQGPQRVHAHLQPAG